MFLNSLARRGRVVALLAGALMLAPIVAEARPGGGKGMGSRGARTEMAPPSTATTPQGAQPFQRSAQPSPASPSAGAAAAQAQRPSMARSLMGGLAFGLLGAGLFGLLSGAGFGGLAGFLGLIAQVALIGGLIYLAMRLFRRRSEPQLAGAGAPLSRAGLDQRPLGARPAVVNAGVTGGGAAAAQASRGEPIQLAAQDFDSFERLLTEINETYSNQDEQGLRQRVTPEMFGYFDEDLSANARRGYVDRVSDVKLLQGDLSEAWREGTRDYATVAMRFSLINALYERSSGRVVEGNPNVAQEVTEYWTFTRDRGGPWQLSGIQAAG